MRRGWVVFIGIVGIAIIGFRCIHMIELELSGFRTTGAIIEYETSWRGWESPVVHYQFENASFESESIEAMWLWKYYPVGSEVAVLVKENKRPVVGGPALRGAHLGSHVVFLMCLLWLVLRQRRKDH